MNTFLLILSALLANGEFILHVEKHVSAKSCQAAVEVISTKLEQSPNVTKYAVDCFPMQDKGV